MARLDESRREDDAAIRQATLEAMLDADERNDALVASARAAASGVDIAQGVQALVAVDPSGESDIIGLLPGATTEFAGSRKPSLATIREGKLIVLARAPISDRVISERLLAGKPNLRVGVGRHVTNVFGVKQSFADAELAVRAFVRDKPNNIVRYEDLDFGTILLNEIPVDRLRPKLEAWLTPLHENPLVFDTVEAYFRCEFDVGRTARCLGLHANSVRYRLQRAEKLIGARLRAPDTIVALQVGLLCGRSDLGTLPGPRTQSLPGDLAVAASSRH
jgi:sugar diacid utilization regulator